MTDGGQTHDAELAAERRFAKFVANVISLLQAHFDDPAALTENADMLNSAAARKALIEMREQRRDLVKDLKQPFFGRLERHGSHGALYVGRAIIRNPGLSVEQDLEDESLLVISWRAPAAAAFYRARPGRAVGLRRKRAFEWLESDLLSYSDEAYSEAEALAVDDGVGALSLQDDLLRDLERERDPYMRDIVATIQADQYDLLERKPRGVLVIQGAPGTGKTAVALHRLSFLAFNFPLVGQRGLVLVGPSDRFLEYVSRVLPSLGDDDIRHRTVAGLLSTTPPETPSRPWRQAKGHVGVASLLRVLVLSHLRPIEQDRVFRLGQTRLTLDTRTARELIGRASEADTYNEARRIILTGAAEHLSEQYTRELGGPDQLRFAEFPDPESALLESRPLATLATDMAPDLQASRLLRSLHGRENEIRRLGENLLPEPILRQLRNSLKENAALDADDVVLIDELEFLLGAEVEKVGHLAIDEAQDLTDMELRALARRVGAGGVTLVGDIGQASVVGRAGWTELASAFPDGDSADLAELRLSYRVPGEVLDYANQVLIFAGTDVRPGVAVRQSVGKLHVHQCGDVQELQERAVSIALSYSASSRSVAVIGTLATLAEMPTTDRQDLQAANVNVLDDLASKGLEFDHVVVLEPVAFGVAPLGLAALYVALTRCTQSLDVVQVTAPEYMRVKASEAGDVEVNQARQALERFATQMEREDVPTALLTEESEGLVGDAYALLEVFEGDRLIEGLSPTAFVAAAKALLEHASHLGCWTDPQV
jgi:DNA helicase IV